MKRLITLILGLVMAAWVPAKAADSRDLTAPQAWAKLQAGEITVLDVRTPREWGETGTIPGALTANLHQWGGNSAFAAQVLELAGQDKDKPLALICRTGSRSTQALALLRSQGFTNLWHIPEGMVGGPNGPGWITRGLPVNQRP